MRNIPAPAVAAIAAGTALVTGALRIMTSPPDCVWGGPGPITADGYTFVGLLENALLTEVAFEIGASEIGINLKVSGVSPQLVPKVMLQDYRGKPTVLYRFVLDQHGTTLLAAVPWFRGTIDNILIIDQPGGASEVTFKIEGVARGLSRAGGRLAADEDQRLIKSTDGSMRHVSSAADLMLAWGGTPPVRAAVGVNGGATINPYAKGVTNGRLGA